MKKKPLHMLFLSVAISGGTLGALIVLGVLARIGWMTFLIGWGAL